MAEILVTRPEHIRRLESLIERGDTLEDEAAEVVSSMIGYIASSVKMRSSGDGKIDEAKIQQGQGLLEDEKALEQNRAELVNEVSKIKIQSVLEKCKKGDVIISYVPYFRQTILSNTPFIISQITELSPYKEIEFLNYCMRQDSDALGLIMNSMASGKSSLSDIENFVDRSPYHGTVELAHSFAEGSPKVESYILTKAEFTALMKKVFLRCPTFSTQRELAKAIDEILFGPVER